VNASATILSWITAEVDQALTRVREQIAKFTAAPGDVALLKPCPEHLHQVSGALRMVGLAGATRFCEEIEGGLAGLDGARPSSQALGVIDKAVLALKDFVDGLERGQSNVPLRLFPVYRELKTLQGKSDAAEKDLFFPDLTLSAPAPADAKSIPAAELPAYLLVQRALFQRGLLAALRGQPAGFGDMRKALYALRQVCAQLPEPRALWWAAEGLLDGFAEPPDADWLARAKALCNKVDFQMRDLAAGAQSVNEALLRELLYAIAKCKPATPRLKEIKQLYQLDGQFPDADAGGVMEYDMDWLAPALADLRARLEALKGMWLQYVSGEPKSAGRFRELVASFKAKAAEVGSAPLVKLLDAIALVASRLPDPYPQDSHALVIEMASAFLLAESLIENFTAPAADAEEQIGIMGGWLLDAAKGKSTGDPPAGLRAELNERIGALKLRAQVAREIVANLQHVEKVLDGFVRDPATRDALPGLANHMRQIHGALTVLGWEAAARVVAICERLIAQCAQADHAGTADDMDWIAEGLSSLGFFLDPCLNGREPAEQAIDLFFRRYEKAHTPPEEREFDSTVVLTAAAMKAADAAEAAVAAAIAAAAAAPKPKVLPARPELNRELLDIYLEEAGEVLAGIDATLPACRAQPQDRDALTTIRRGFHTLKGSGRMVGLMDLGEVAWEIEQVLNLWLEQKWPASAELLELIARGSSAFARWVAQLREGSLTQEIEADDLVELAARLKQVETPAPVSVPVVQPAPALQPEPAADAVPATIAEAEPAFDFILRGQTGPMPVVVQEAGLTPAPAMEAMPELAAERTAPPPPPDLPQDVLIGDVRVAPHLFDIYLKEALQHVAALEAQVESWRASPGSEVSPAFERAAHTLASSSRTTGFAPLAALASALEQWTRHAPLTVAASDVGAVVAAIEGLRERIEAVARREVPASVDALDGALRALVARLLVPPPPKAHAKAAPAREAKGGREQRVLRDDIDAQLLPVFLDEAQQLLPQIGADLRDWKAKPGDAQASRSLQRALHTLKGSARMAGAIRLGELTHIMESRIDAALGAGDVSGALFGELEQKLDRLSLDLERMQYAPEPGAAAPAEAPRAEAPLPSPAAMLRVNADTLDQLINESGEVSIARTRVEAELRAVKQSIADLSDSVARLRGQLREIEVQADSQMQSRATELETRNREFDPLEFDRYTRLQELTRLMAESLHDATSIQQTLAKSLGDADGALAHQARVSRDVQQSLMRMRAVPFANLNERLYRIVRQTARELDKQAELDIQGSQVELDRSVLERIGAPLEHMLRNALAHGLEAPEARLAAGKPPAGRIAVSLRQEANEIALTVSDDGAGLDLEKLRRRALERGIRRPDTPESDAEAAQLIFVSGLSTADEVTELAGRGVGMDVVRSEIGAIGGRVDIATTRGQGTTFTVYLPLTLAVTQAVLVRAAGAACAVPSAMVEQVLRLKADAMAAQFAANAVEFQGRRYPLYDLASLQGGTPEPMAPGYHSVLLLRSGAQRIGLHVDELLGNQEVVVKAIGPQLARVPGVAGATVLADGRIALIVNPVQLVQRSRGAPLRETTQPAPAVSAAPMIMVVDDSLTVRKITGRLLEREGYRVLAAKDGVDALELMKDARPAVMLVDIEMPRMDGFDLTRAVRADPGTRDIPIIMISSRTAGKHRDQAVQLGVNAFLGKPYPEADLLQHIARFLEAARA
jgi:chemosensory pili system protein ChpA (sensor histidine kinase/response regulator)